MITIDFTTPYMAGDRVTSLTLRPLLDGDSKHYDIQHEELSTGNILKAALKEINHEPLTDKSRDKAIDQLPVPYAEYCLYRLLEASDPYHDVTIAIVCSKCNGITELPAVCGVEESVKSIEITTDLELRQPITTKWKGEEVVISHIMVRIPTLSDYIAADRMRLSADQDAIDRTIRTKCIIDCGGVIPTSGLIEQLSIADRRRWKSWINRQQIISYQQEGKCSVCGSVMVYRREASPFFV